MQRVVLSAVARIVGRPPTSIELPLNVLKRPTIGQRAIQ